MVVITTKTCKNIHKKVQATKSIIPKVPKKLTNIVPTKEIYNLVHNLAKHINNKQYNTQLKLNKNNERIASVRVNRYVLNNQRLTIEEETSIVPQNQSNTWSNVKGIVELETSDVRKSDLSTIILNEKIYM